VSARLAASAACLALGLSGCSLALLATTAARRAWTAREVRVDEPVRGDTRHPDGRVNPRCAAHERPTSDQGWRFVATRSGAHTVHVRAVHDATVSVYDGDRELSCDDDGAAVGEPRASFDARTGRVYTIVVDGYRGERGPYELTVSRAP
jgi:hypothetical protein